MKKHVLFVSILVAVLAQNGLAQTRGFVETFDTSESADTWVYWTDGQSYYPEWMNDPDPYIWGAFSNNTAYLWGDTNSSGRKVTGNYVTNRIAGLQADVYVDYPEDVECVSIYFYSGADSNEYVFGFWHLEDTDWHTLYAPLNATNWWVDEIVGCVTPSTQVLSHIEEVGIIAYPVTGLQTETYVNLDNFALVPEMVRPVLSLSLNTNETSRMSFVGLQGQSYAVRWCDNLQAANWQLLPGCTNIIGSNTTVSALDTNQRSRCFYRASSSIHLSK